MQNKKHIYIVGAGGSGRELESWFHNSFADSEEWNIVGFLDDNLNALDGFLSDYNVLGRIDEFNFGPDDFVAISVANPMIKEQIYNRLKNRVKFFTYIDPSVIKGKDIEIGEGSIVCPKCLISTNVKIGKCVYLNIGTQVGHDCEIGDFSSLMASVDLGGECLIGEKVFMGTKSMVIPRKSVSLGIFVGAGSVVIRNLKKKGTYFGNPALLLK